MGKYKKLEMLIFVRENLKSWVYMAKHYFEINDLADTEKVKVKMKLIDLGEATTRRR